MLCVSVHVVWSKLRLHFKSAKDKVGYNDLSKFLNFLFKGYCNDCFILLLYYSFFFLKEKITVGTPQFQVNSKITPKNPEGQDQEVFCFHCKVIILNAI